ncbi:hypothetical protein SLA2020_388300 [Shorea laevis]
MLSTTQKPNPSRSPCSRLIPRLISQGECQNYTNSLALFVGTDLVLQSYAVLNSTSCFKEKTVMKNTLAWVEAWQVARNPARNWQAEPLLWGDKELEDPKIGPKESLLPKRSLLHLPRHP